MKTTIQIIALSCCLLLTACAKFQSSPQANTHSTTESAITEHAVTESAVSVSAIREETPTSAPSQKSEFKTSANICPTIELPLKNMNYTARETKLGVPGCSQYYYVKNNSEIIADDLVSIDDIPATSYILNDKNRWEEKTTPFDLARKRKIIDTVSHVTHRPNGDYVFINNGFHYSENAEIVRMTETGYIKSRLTLENLFPKNRYLKSMAYLGKGKAVIQTQDDHFDTYIYEWQDNSILHLDCINISTGKIEQSYPDGWRLCGAINSNYIFAEKDKKIIKVDVKTGEIVKKYSTEAIWSQGWQEETLDDDGTFYHDHAITWTTFNGKLYAKHVSGIFELDEKNLCWKQLLSYKKGFNMGPMYNNVFVMLDDNKAMLMAYRCDDECATDCCIYEWD